MISNLGLSLILKVSQSSAKWGGKTNFFNFRKTIHMNQPQSFTYNSVQNVSQKVSNPYQIQQSVNEGKLYYDSSLTQTYLQYGMILADIRFQLLEVNQDILQV